MSNEEWLIVTQNVWGHRMPGVVAARIVDHDRVELGLTDERGELRARFPSRPTPLVEVEAAGYARTSVQLDAAAADRRVVFVLRGESSLLGVVSTSSGPPPLDTRVYCWPAESPPSSDELLANRERPLRLWITNVDRSGRFEVAGLDPRVPYTLAGGATGWTSKEWILAARPGDTEHRLELWRLHACEARFTSTSGEALRTPWRLARQPRLTGLRDGEETRVGPRSLDLALSGVAPLTSERSETLQVVLAVKTSRESPPPAVRLMQRVPGYGTGQWDFSLPTFQGMLEAKSFALEPTVACWADVTLDLIRDVGQETHSRDAWIWLVLSPEGGGEEMRIPIWTLLDHERIENVPCGLYRCGLEVGELHRVPTHQELVTIAEGPAPVHLVFDLAGLATIELDLETPNGVDAGPITVNLLDSSTRRQHYFHFTGAPYRLRGIPEGRYALRVQRLPLIAWKAWTTQPFDVAPGELVRVPVIAPHAP
ncbi:MAG: hypothetical protein ACKVWV_02730 [Planctomycetota bacterium]